MENPTTKLPTGKEVLEKQKQALLDVSGDLTPELAEARKELELAKTKAEIEKNNESIRLSQSNCSTMDEWKEKKTNEEQDLKKIIMDCKELKENLDKEKIDFFNEHNKAIDELKELQQKVDDESDALEIATEDNKRRMSMLLVREKRCQELEAVLDTAQREKMIALERYNSLSETIKREFPQYIKIMKDNASKLKYFNDRYGWVLANELKKVEGWFNDDCVANQDKIVNFMKVETENVYACTFKLNKGNSGILNDFIGLITKDKSQDFKMNMANSIVDNIFYLFKIIPELKLKDLPKDEEEEKEVKKDVLKKENKS
jgi:hypothetical protein